MVKKISILAIIASITIACNSSKTNKNINDESTISSDITAVKYFEAENYFVVNTFKSGDLKSPKITSAEDFDKIFHPAATMTQSQATPINWEKEFVVGIIDEKSDLNPSMTIKSVVLKNNQLVVNYMVKDNAKTTFTMQPCKIVVIENKYKNSNVVLNRVKP